MSFLTGRSVFFAMGQSVFLRGTEVNFARGRSGFVREVELEEVEVSKFQ